MKVDCSLDQDHPCFLTQQCRAQLYPKPKENWSKYFFLGTKKEDISLYFLELKIGPIVPKRSFVENLQNNSSI